MTVTSVAVPTYQRTILDQYGTPLVDQTDYEGARPFASAKWSPGSLTALLHDHAAHLAVGAWTLETDSFGPVWLASARERTLHDSVSNDNLGPATHEQAAASDESAEGHVVVDENGDVWTEHEQEASQAWARQAHTFRTVYVSS